MGGRHPIAHRNLMQDKVFRGEMCGTKVVLIRPSSDLSSSDYGDHWINHGYLYLIIWNVRVIQMLIDDTVGEFKCVSPHNRLLEVRTSKIPYVL